MLSLPPVSKWLIDACSSDQRHNTGLCLFFKVGTHINRVENAKAQRRKGVAKVIFEMIFAVLASWRFQSRNGRITVS